MNKIYTIFLFCLLSLLSSCHNKELCPDCYNEPGIEVQFNWSEVTTIPNGMRVNFYNQDGSLAYSFNLPSSGGSITIKQGDYKVLCFNNDSEYIQYRDQDNYYSMSFFTSEGEPISGTTPIDGQVRNNPQYLCYDTLSSQKIYGSYNKEQIVKLTPFDPIDYYYYTLENIENAQYITSISATLSGLKTSLYPGDPNKVSTLTTMKFTDNKYDSNEKTVTGYMTNFGINKNETNSNILTIYITTKYGKYTKSFDVTKQDEDAKNPRDVHLTIDNTFVIPIPIADGFDNGIEPEVKKWIIIEDSIYL